MRTQRLPIPQWILRAAAVGTIAFAALMLASPTTTHADDWGGGGFDSYDYSDFYADSGSGSDVSFDGDLGGSDISYDGSSGDFSSSGTGAGATEPSYTVDPSMEPLPVDLSQPATDVAHTSPDTNQVHVDALPEAPVQPDISLTEPLVIHDLHGNGGTELYDGEGNPIGLDPTTPATEPLWYQTPTFDTPSTDWVINPDIAPITPDVFIEPEPLVFTDPTFTPIPTITDPAPVTTPTPATPFVTPEPLVVANPTVTPIPTITDPLTPVTEPTSPVTPPTDWVINPDIAPITPDVFIEPEPLVFTDPTFTPIPTITDPAPVTTPAPAPATPAFDGPQPADIGIDPNVLPDDSGMFSSPLPAPVNPTDWTVDPDLTGTIEPTPIAPTDPILLPAPQLLNESSNPTPPATPTPPIPPAAPTTPAAPGIPALPTFTPIEDLGFDPTYDPDSTGTFTDPGLGEPTDWNVNPNLAGTLTPPKPSIKPVVEPDKETIGVTGIPIGNSGITGTTTVCVSAQCKGLQVNAEIKVKYPLGDGVSGSTSVGASVRPLSPGTELELKLGQELTGTLPNGSTISLGTNITFTTTESPTVTFDARANFFFGRTTFNVNGTIDPKNGSGTIAAGIQWTGFGVMADATFTPNGGPTGRVLIWLGAPPTNGLEVVKPPVPSPEGFPSVAEPNTSTPKPDRGRFEIDCSMLPFCPPMAPRDADVPTFNLDGGAEFNRPGLAADAQTSSTPIAGLGLNDGLSSGTFSSDPNRPSLETLYSQPSVDTDLVLTPDTFDAPTMGATSAPWVPRPSSGPAPPKPARNIATSGDTSFATATNLGPLDVGAFESSITTGSEPWLIASADGSIPSRPPNPYTLSANDTVSFDTSVESVLGGGDLVGGGGSFDRNPPDPGLFDLAPAAQQRMNEREVASFVQLKPDDIVYALLGIVPTGFNQAAFLGRSPSDFVSWTVVPKSFVTDLGLGLATPDEQVFANPLADRVVFSTSTGLVSSLLNEGTRWLSPKVSEYFRRDLVLHTALGPATMFAVPPSVAFFDGIGEFARNTIGCPTSTAAGAGCRLVTKSFGVGTGVAVPIAIGSILDGKKITSTLVTAQTLRLGFTTPQFARQALYTTSTQVASGLKIGGTFSRAVTIGAPVLRNVSWQIAIAQVVTSPPAVKIYDLYGKVLTGQADVAAGDYWIATQTPQSGDGKLTYRVLNFVELIGNQGCDYDFSCLPALQRAWMGCDAEDWIICPGTPGHPAGQPRLGPYKNTYKPPEDWREGLVYKAGQLFSGAPGAFDRAKKGCNSEDWIRCPTATSAGIPKLGPKPMGPKIVGAKKVGIPQPGDPNWGRGVGVACDRLVYYICPTTPGYQDGVPWKGLADRQAGHQFNQLMQPLPPISTNGDPTTYTVNPNPGADSIGIFNQQRRKTPFSSLPSDHPARSCYRMFSTDLCKSLHPTIQSPVSGENGPLFKF
jgi:hypothetical protein